MSKIINGVASEYDIPMVYDNKSTTNRIKNEEIFTRWQDPTIEKLQQENKQLQNNWNELKKYIDNNKKVLQNPQILDFYLKMQELEGNNE